MSIRPGRRHAAIAALSAAATVGIAAEQAPSPQPPSRDLWSTPVSGGATARLIDISFDVMAVGGTSTATDDEIRTLDAGGHDPSRRGFTLQQTELSVGGAVDPYFRCEAHIVPLEDAIELEEAFAETTSLPEGVRLKAGYFYTEFGRLNPTHPHAWKWIDQPLISSRLLGGDGTRGIGLRGAWLTPLPWYSQIYLSVQNADNASMASFRGAEPGATETVGGWPIVPETVRTPADLLYLARWENSTDSEDVTIKQGVSFLAGPNDTGGDGRTRIYGLDLAVRWRPPGGQQGFPYVLGEAEVMGRDYAASDQGGAPADTLHDWGFYAQALYGFTEGWSAGLRYERATGSGDSIGPFADRSADPLRDDRTRVSPMLVWNPTHFSRLRLEYSYDRADHLPDGHAHSVWLGFEILIGSHPAHTF